MKDWINKKTIGAACAGVFVIILAASSRTDPKDKAVTSSINAAKVLHAPMAITVTGSGEIQSRDSHKIVPKIKQSATISFLVSDGTRVKKGELLARLNTDSLDRKIEDQEQDLEEAMSSLDTRQTEMDIQKLENQTSLKSAKQSEEKSKLELSLYLEGEMPLKRRKVELDLATTKSELQRKEKRFEDLKELLKEGFVTEDEVEESRMTIESAKVNLETATIQKQVLEEYTIPLDKSVAENALEKASNDLERTIKRNESLMRNQQRHVRNSMQKVKGALEDLEKAQEERGAYEITAPADGVVQYGDPRYAWRRAEIEVGATIQRGMVIMTIPELTGLQADINISESDIQKVQVGQKAFVHVDALTGTTIDGTVIKVAEVPNSANIFGADIKEFRVEITLTQTEGLKPGFSCKAEIRTLELADAIQVPIQALFQDGDAFYVYTKQGRKNTRCEVSIGEASPTHVQILKGLEENAWVLLNHPKEEARP